MWETSTSRRGSRAILTGWPVASPTSCAMRSRAATGRVCASTSHSDAVLDTSNETGRRKIAGADAIVAHLARSRPGSDRATGTRRNGTTGVALSFEWQGRGGPDRRRWYVRTGRRRPRSPRYGARPRGRRSRRRLPPVAPPQRFSAQLGATRRRAAEPRRQFGRRAPPGRRDDGTAFVLKRVERRGRPTGSPAPRDDEGRTAQLYAAGAFDRMPRVHRPRHRRGRARRTMRPGSRCATSSAQLLPPDARLSRDESRRILAAAADLHRAFRDRVPPGAASLSDRIGMSSPGVADAERPQPDLLPKQFEQGWDAFGELVPADVADAVLGSTRGPAAGRRAPRAYGGTTLIHGDLRGDNLGFDGDRLVLIDWDLATAGTPTRRVRLVPRSLRPPHRRRRTTRSKPTTARRRETSSSDDRARARHGLRPRPVRLAHRPQRPRPPRSRRDRLGPGRARLVGAPGPERPRAPQLARSPALRILALTLGSINRRGEARRVATSSIPRPTRSSRAAARKAMRSLARRLLPEEASAMIQ